MAKNHYYLPDAQERGQDHTESACRAKNGAKRLLSRHRKEEEVEDKDGSIAGCIPEKSYH